MLEGLFDQPGMAALERAVHLLDARRSAIAANLANADTPGYRPVDVTFAQTFDRVRLGTGAQGGDGLRFVAEAPGRMRLDGNGVDVDAEMARLSETVLWYAAASRLLGHAFDRLQAAIQGGGV